MKIEFIPWDSSNIIPEGRYLFRTQTYVLKRINFVTSEVQQHKNKMSHSIRNQTITHISKTIIDGLG